MLDLIYWQLTIGIVIVTEVVKHKIFPFSAWVQSKWLTLAVAVLGGIAHWWGHDDTDVWKLVTSLGVAVLFYDYIWRVVKDIFVNLKDPFGKQP